MKKVFFLSTIILCLNSNMSAQNDFRQFNWGDNIGKVKSSLKSKLVLDEKETIGLEGTLMGEDVLIFYDFVNGKLCGGSYLFNNKYSTTTDHLKIYKKVKEELKLKYGELLAKDEKWFNDTFKDDEAFKEMAILSGHLEFDGKWANDKTKINLVLKKDKKLDSQLMLIYFSKELYSEWYKTKNHSGNEL